MIQSSTSGGEFQYVEDARNVEKNTVNVSLIESILQNKYPVEGSGIYNYPNEYNYIARVTELKGTDRRSKEFEIIFNRK